MAKCGRYKYSEAEKLNFQEANKLLDIEDALDFAVQVYEDVRSNRQALLKEIMREVDKNRDNFISIDEFNQGMTLQLKAAADF